MPQSATGTNTNSTIIYTDDQLKNLHKGVSQNLTATGINSSSNQIRPSHIPDEGVREVIDHKKTDIEESIPESFKSTPQTALSPLKALSEHLDFADQLVTGRSHVVGESSVFTAHKSEKEDKRMIFANQDKKDLRNPVKKLVDWLYK